MVLLDTSPAAPAAVVSDRACSASCQQAANSVDRHELPPVRSANGRGRGPGFGISGSDPHGRACDRAAGYDCHGDHQSHGVGDVPALARSLKVWELGDNRQPSRAAPRAVCLQLRPLFPVLG